MTEPIEPDLEARLARLSEWPGEAPQVWRRALAAAGGGAGTSLWTRELSFADFPRWAARQLVSVSILRFVAGIAACMLLLAICSSLFLPSLSRARAPSKSPLSASRMPDSPGYSQDPEDFRPGSWTAGEATMPAADTGGGKGAGRFLSGQASDGGPDEGFHGPKSGATLQSAPTDRIVIRKVTMELLTADVRAAFLKAQHVLSEAGGEYVQESSLAGDEKRLEGALTLRVAAVRLSEVLGQLRELGTVRAERAGGEDVTAQVVDLEARLRNERSVEAEMLKLLESRQNAELKDILELRGRIGGVRQAIEQLVAQRDRLGKLASLATVLVIIRPADAPPPPEPQAGMLAYFSDSLGHAWQRGTRFLADTVAGFVVVLIGGAAWWVLGIAALLMARMHLRKHAAPRT